MSQLQREDVIGALAAARQRAGEKEGFLPVVLAGEASWLAAEGEVVEVEGQQWSIRRVAGELGLRRALVGCEEDPTVALILPREMPLAPDLAPRVAGRKVQVVGRKEKLLRMFGAKIVEPGLDRSELGKALADEPPPGIHPINGERLTREEAWRQAFRCWLDLSGVGLFGLARAVLRGPARAAVWVDGRGRLAEEAEAAFERAFGGVAGRCLGRAWVADKGHELLGLLVLWHAAREAGELVEKGFRERMHYLSGYQPELAAAAGQPGAAIQELFPLVDGLFQELAAEAPGAEELRTLEAASRRVGAREEELLRWSPHLPEGLQRIWADIGRGLWKCVKSPEQFGTEEHERLLGNLERAVGHRAMRGSAGEVERQRLEAARHGVRLATFGRLAGGPDGLKTWMQADLAGMVEWYVREGAWVDRGRAALRAQGPVEGELAEGLREVQTHVDGVRRELDGQFALKVSSRDWPDDVLGVDRVIQRFGAPFLDAQSDARLLVLMMDGMSLPVGLCLREAMEGWSLVDPGDGEGAGWRGALSALPTLTATSRAAFFAGYFDVKHGDQPEGQDENRFAEHRAWLGRSRPPLFMKGKVGSRGVLSDDLRRTLENPEVRVVGVVLNVVDEQLKGSSQLRVDWGRIEQVPLLGALMAKAASQCMRVLLASDHGHVEVTEVQRAPEGVQYGQRYRAVSVDKLGKPTESLIEGEVLLHERWWRPKQGTRVAALWPEERGWGMRGGAHGGLAMAEVITPVALLEPRTVGFAAQRGNPAGGRAGRGDEPPVWWQLRRGTLHEEAVSPETKGRRGKKVEDSPQGILLQPTAPPAAPVRVRAAVGRDPMVEQALRLVYPRIGSWTADRQTLAERVLERLILAPGCQEAVEVMTGGLGCPKRAVRNLLDDLEGALDFGGVKLVRLKEEDRAELNRALLDELVSSEADKGGRNGGKA